MANIRAVTIKTPYIPCCIKERPNIAINYITCRSCLTSTLSWSSHALLNLTEMTVTTEASRRLSGYKGHNSTESLSATSKPGKAVLKRYEVDSFQTLR